MATAAVGLPHSHRARAFWAWSVALLELLPYLSCLVFISFVMFAWGRYDNDTPEPAWGLAAIVFAAGALGFLSGGLGWMAVGYIRAGIVYLVGRFVLLSITSILALSAVGSGLKCGDQPDCGHWAYLAISPALLVAFIAPGISAAMLFVTVSTRRRP